MEHTTVQSDLESKDIQPQDLASQYDQLLVSDIQTLLKRETFNDVGCPSNKEVDVRRSFEKLSMTYNISQTFGNIYVSPRPTKDALIDFAKSAESRKLWLNKIWPQTHEMRLSKIIRPQLQWVRTFIQQYLENKFLSVAEVYPNQWGYLQEVNESALSQEYHLIDPMFNVEICPIDKSQYHVLSQDDTREKFDVIYLFEALDRAANPEETLQWINDHLKPGGLVFITGFLASGLEIQTLAEASKAIMPPERLNIFSYEGLLHLIRQQKDWETLEFSTTGVLDVENIKNSLKNTEDSENGFIQYILNRNDANLEEELVEFLQKNKLSSFGRLVIKKNDN